MLENNKNLIILRTFSKAYSMAALRLGYMMAHKSVAEAVNKVRLPYNINALTQACAEIMLGFDIYKTVEGIITERDRMYNVLKGLYPAVKSDANFLLLKPADIKKAKNMFEKSGISIRMFNSGVLSGWMRVTIGTPKENEAVLKILSRGV